MKASIVVGDLREQHDVELVGATSRALVFEAMGPQGRGRVACDRMTGERVELREELATLEPAAAELEQAGVRVAVRERRGAREVCRFHSDGWVESALGLADGARVVATDRHLVATGVGGGKPFVWLLGAVGPVVAFALPVWVFTDAPALPSDAAWSVTAVKPARALVLVSSERATWLTFEQLAALHAGIERLPARAEVELAAVLPGTLGDGELVVREGSTTAGLVKRQVTLEDRAGQRFAVSTFAATPMPVGTRYRLRDVTKAFPLLVAVGGGPMVRVEDMAPLGTEQPRAPLFPALETRPSAWPTPGSKARGLVTPQVRARVERLAQLGLASALDAAAIDEAITCAFGTSHMAPYHGAVGCAMILRAHWLAYPPPTDRARLDQDAIAFASRDNASASGTRRWALVMTNSYEPLVLCLEPAEHAAIEGEGLLLFEPLPASAAPSADLASAIAELATLIGAGPGDVVVSEEGRVSLSLIAASALEQRLAYPGR